MCALLNTWSCIHAPSCGLKTHNRTAAQVLADRAAQQEAGRKNMEALEAAQRDRT
jgi:hypothetical protein